MFILDQLRRGELDPSRKPIPPGSDYEILLQRYTGLDDHLRSVLSPEQKATLSEMQSIRSSLQEIESAQDFTAAFRLGALLMLDILTENCADR